MAKVSANLYASSNTGAALSSLTKAHDITWQDPPNEMGSFSFKLPLGDADVAACTFGRVVRTAIAGVERFSGVIDRVEPTPIEEQTEGAATVTVSGSGQLIELDEAKTMNKPAGRSPGTIADIFPPVDDRPMEWFGMDFDDSSGWEDSVEVGVHGEVSAVYPGLPGGMRVLGAKYIWLDGAADDFLFFREWVFLSAGYYVLDFAAYDAGCFINGRRHPRNAAYGEKELVEFTVINSGYILLAFEADLRDTNFDVGLVWQITEGEDGPLVYASGSDMQVYGTPDAVLSMTADEILHALKNDHPALDDWTFDFGSGLDSDGGSLSDTTAVSARIGDDSLWDVLSALAEVYIDFDADHDSKTLHIWEKGTHATTPTIDLVAGGSTAAALDPSTVNIVELSWDVQRAPFNALLVRYESGWFTRPAILQAEPRWDALGVQHIASGATAIEFADAVLAKVGVDQETATIGLIRNLPDTDLPYVGFDKWSTIDVPSRSDLNSTTAMPVAAITCEGDADGDLVTTLELGSYAELQATRVQRWIARSTRGGLSGLVQMAQAVTQTLQQRPPGLNHTEIKIIDVTDATAKVGVSKSGNMPGKGLLHKLYAMVNDPGGGTSEIDVTVGGVTVTLSGTTAAGYQLLDLDENLNIPYDPRTPYSGSVVAADHDDITVYACVSEYR